MDTLRAPSKGSLRAFFACFLGLAAAVEASAYILSYDESGIYTVKWQASPIAMQVKLSSTSNLSDGTSQSGTVATAMQTWNAQLGTMALSSQILAPGAHTEGNGINEIVMDSTISGKTFSAGTLAITLLYTRGNAYSEADMVFNTAYTWDSYRGALRSGVQDLRRVALHELGHVLGLNHPDEGGQSVVAVMNSHVSGTDSLQSDDIAGAQRLYAAPGAVPANNSFAHATAIASSPNSQQLTGTNIGGDREPGEPQHAGTPSGHSVWWTWTAGSDGTVALSTLGSDFDTVLAVYTGSTLSALTEVASNDDEETPEQNTTAQRKRTSLVSFPAVSGTTYRIAVDGWASTSEGVTGYTGSIALTLSFVPYTAPIVVTQAVTQSVLSGRTAQFTISATGNPAPSFRWQRLSAGGTWADLTEGGAYSGTSTGTLAVSTQVAMNGDQFRCVVSNSAGTTISNASTLQVTQGSGITPVLTWAPPAAIAAGTALDATELHASANVPGTFVYSPAAGTVLGVGTHTLSVSFTPTDLSTYSTATADVTLTVLGSATHLVNIATRAYCGIGSDVTIGGFVVTGSGSKRVLIRAVGPSLTTQGLGQNEVLLDPTVELHQGAPVIASNDNWLDNANAAEIASISAQIGANALASGDTKSSALLLTLNPGVYSFVVSGQNASSGIVLLEVYDADTASAGSTFVNIATRAYATTGGGVAIGGFVISGSSPKQVLLRAVGPTLTTQGIGQSDVLLDPTIELHQGAATLMTNDNWGDNANAAAITTTAARIGATPFDGSDTKSSALLTTLQPGVYSFIASGKNNTSGIVLVEVYDAD